jgi:hypothetical protein
MSGEIDGKKYPYCKLTVTGACFANNKMGWAELSRNQAREAEKKGDKEDADELYKAANETESEIIYCSICPYVPKE